MSRVFAIGDLHGCRNTFEHLLTEEIKIKRSDKIYCLGDYVGRGPNAKGVIDYILKLRKKGYAIHTLRGNHEALLLDAAKDAEKQKLWLSNGGVETLESFGIKSLKRLPEKYEEFLKRTKFYIATSENVFVHAGLNFSIPDPFADKRAMLWTREPLFIYHKIQRRILVHGHTPISIAQLHSQPSIHKINIDTGCVYKSRIGCGHLTAVELPSKEFISVRNID